MEVVSRDRRPASVALNRGPLQPVASPLAVAPASRRSDGWHGLLAVGDEHELVHLIVQLAREKLSLPAAAAILWSDDDGSAAFAADGFEPQQTRILLRREWRQQDLHDLCAGARLAGSVGYSDGRHPWWGLGPLVFITVRDDRANPIGLILVGNPATRRLPAPHTRVTLELLAHAAAGALLSIQQRRAEEARIRTVETQKRQLEALLEASAQVHGLNLDEVLQRIARTMTADGGFQRAAVYLRDDEDMLHARAFIGVPRHDMERIRAPVPFAVFAHLMRPEMQVSRSFIFDHRRHEVPSELLAALSIPEERGCAPGEWHPLDSLTIPLQGRDGQTIGLVSMDEPHDGRYPDLARVQVLELFAGACAVAVEQARLYDEVQRLAMTDPLTGLHNRRSFEGALRRELARVRRADSACSILFCDLDGLKQLNDAQGHDVGDRALQAVAQLLRARLREGDLSARLGGDEFVVMLPDTHAHEAVTVAEEIRALSAALGSPPLPPGVSISVSVGVAGTEGRHAVSPEELLSSADRALYSAKTAGRNQVDVA